ncbi:2'-5' RNA ligase family protein [Sphingobium sp.]|uniref:2'-5' RNA ligase family protein n=1 Tax=Sphingobium sp. TaxID=1912891 RepID=UPI002B859655|nr:2'-5' RNA ligase family protein [Sphingobium sp.]HUD90556.1 2'-5' RNA ligase family protein [Sphingobium sp.]
MHVRTQPLYRLFFAVKPPLVMMRKIDHFAERVDPDAHRIRPEHQHVTLGITADWSDYPYERIKALRRAAANIMAEPFDLLLDRLNLSGESAALRPSHSIAGLKLLQGQVADAMLRADVMPRPGWSFSPHQTLFYRRGAPDQRPIDGFSWRVDEVVLICSHVGRTRHDLIGTWSLKGSGQYSLF